MPVVTRKRRSTLEWTVLAFVGVAFVVGLSGFVFLTLNVDASVNDFADEATGEYGIEPATGRDAQAKPERKCALHVFLLDRIRQAPTRLTT